MSEHETIEKNFKFAASLIKIIAVIIAMMVLIISKYAFIFFIAAMLPTIFAIFFDKNQHKCLSATICSFNLIGVLPYLIRIWESQSVDFVSKQILVNLETWMTIYGAAFIGQLLYASMPLLIMKIYTTKLQIKVKKYKNQHEELCAQWGIDTEIE
jgi:hypothetical protein